MTANTNFENLANEVLLEIFDHLRPIDIIHAFSSLNNRLETLLLHRRMHIDLSQNLSLHEFQEYCSKILIKYSSCIYSIRLSNVETCGGMRIFFQEFSQLHLTFPHLMTMGFIEPNEKDYQVIVNLKQLTDVQVKFRKTYEREIPVASIFDISNLETCILSSHDVFSINKFRPNSSLRRLVLDSFYINDLHFLFHFYPSLEYLAIHRLTVHFPGFLPPFNTPIQLLHTLKLNCHYTVRFDYIAYLLSFCPHLIRLSVIAIGLDFLSSERWINMLSSLTQLRSLFLDIKAVSTTFDEELSLAFLTRFWRQWHVAVDYSQDNQKYHLYTVPYRRRSFISTIHSLAIAQAPTHTFNSVTDLYLKTNMPMEIVNKRLYPNVHALQIYQNTVISINPSLLLEQLYSMLDLNKLTHFELFIPLPPSNFLALLQLTPSLRWFKTDYDILMVLTDHLRELDICSHLHDKLDRFVLRRGALPFADNDRFLEIFSQVKYLQINLNTIDDLRRIALKFVRMMHRLLTLQIYLMDIDQMNDIPQWEGIMNHISYEIAKRYVKIWK